MILILLKIDFIFHQHMLLLQKMRGISCEAWILCKGAQWTLSNKWLFKGNCQSRQCDRPTLFNFLFTIRVYYPSQQQLTLIIALAATLNTVAFSLIARILVAVSPGSRLASRSVKALVKLSPCRATSAWHELRSSRRRAIAVKKDSTSFLIASLHSPSISSESSAVKNKKIIWQFV